MTPEGQHPHPSGSGGWAAGRRGSQWSAWLHWAAAARCGWGCASRRPGNFHWAAAARRQWAGAAPYRGAQAVPERGGRRRRFLGPRTARPRPPAGPRPPPAAAARRFLSRFLLATPRPPGQARPAEKLGGVAAAATRAAGPGKTKGGCVRPRVRKRGAGGGRPGAAPPLGAYCLPRARPHALNKKLTHPAAAYQPIDSQTNSKVIVHRESF